MNQRNFIIPVTIVGVILIVIIAGFIIFNPHSDRGDKQIHSGDAMDNTTQIIKESKKIEVQTTNIEPNTKPQFKVGDKFEYELTSNYGGLGAAGPHTNKITFTVNKIERINGTGAYVLEYADMKNGSGVIVDTYVDINIGKIIGCTLKLVYPDGRVEEENMDNETIFNLNQYLYADWMLALDDGLKWKVSITKTEKKRIDPELTDEQAEELIREMGRTGKSYEEILNIPISTVKTTDDYEFKVEGIEKIKVGNKERDCFKVVRIQKEGNKIVGDKLIMWIDAEKRILVKREDWVENLRLMEINLVSEL